MLGYTEALAPYTHPGHAGVSHSFLDGVETCCLEESRVNVLLALGLPLIVAMIVLWCMLEDADHRCYFTRYLCEWRPLMLLGECSYPLFVFQLLLVNFYFELAAGTEEEYAFKKYEYAYQWGQVQSVPLQFSYILCVIGFSVVLQKVFQERLVGWCVAQYLSRKREQPSKANDNTDLGDINLKENTSVRVMANAL
jgi:peptidoglycan/LPS O-acetylase OafA/YrhL